MQFEFNAKKSRRNKRERDLDFVEAQALWQDANRVEIRSPYVPEERWLVIGQMHRKHWTAIVTYRGDNIRIISVRRSRKREVRTYEKNQR